LIEFLSVFLFFLFFLLLIVYVKIPFSEIVILFGVFAFASLKLLPTLINIVRSIQLLRYNYANVSLIFDEIVVNKKNNFLKESIKISEPINKIIFNSVSFKHLDSKDNILENLNFEINLGDKIGIIGETGSGKTTLTNLISGLIEPSEGEIIINGKKTSNYNFFDQLGYVAQNVYLTDDTILSNIAFEKKISGKQMTRLENIIQKLNLQNLIDSSPQKLDTIIGERGSKLSGGQIQRIGIARALLNNPNILILDEASSSLDEKTEEEVLNNIFSLMADKIVIFSTHRKKVLSYCNKILEINNKNITLKTNNFIN